MARQDQAVHVGDPLLGADTVLYKTKGNAAVGATVGAGVALLSYLLQSRKKPRARRLLWALLHGAGAGVGTFGVMQGLNKLYGTNFSHLYRVPDKDDSGTLLNIYVSGSGAGAWEGRTGRLRALDQVNGEGNTLVVNPHDLRYAEGYLRELRKTRPDIRLRITGHSHGGAAAMRLADTALGMGFDVDHLNTVDPIFRFSRPYSRLAGKLSGKWDNYYATKANWRFLPDLWAILGGRHGDIPGASNHAISDNRYNNHTDIMRLPQFSGRQYPEQDTNDADKPSYWWLPAREDRK